MLSQPRVSVKCDRTCHLPSGSRSCGMPSSVSANKKASCRFCRLGLLHTRSMSTRLGRRAWITAKNANPVRQLGPKSFTSIPRRLERIEHYNVKADGNSTLGLREENVFFNSQHFTDNGVVHFAYLVLRSKTINQ